MTATHIVKTLGIGRRLGLALGALACAGALHASPATADTGAQAPQGAAERSSSPWTVSFGNQTAATVNVAVAYRVDGTCSGQGARTQGWWRLAPGQVKRAFTTSYDIAFFYADSTNGRVWEGDDLHTRVYARPFTSCTHLRLTDPMREVGMRRIDLRRAGPNYTIHLT
jgi:uncharacterized membrane protein